MAKHGVPFKAVDDFDWDTAIETADTRRDYGEKRMIAFGRIGGCVHVLIYVPRGKNTRVISLRKANARERRDYEKATQT